MAELILAFFSPRADAEVGVDTTVVMRTTVVNDHQPPAISLQRVEVFFSGHPEPPVPATLVGGGGGLDQMWRATPELPQGVSSGAQLTLTARAFVLVTHPNSSAEIVPVTKDVLVVAGESHPQLTIDPYPPRVTGQPRSYPLELRGTLSSSGLRQKHRYLPLSSCRRRNTRCCCWTQRRGVDDILPGSHVRVGTPGGKSAELP